MSNPDRASSFDPLKGYKSVVWIRGNDDSDYSRNEEQLMQDNERTRLAEAILVEGAIMLNGFNSLVTAVAGPATNALINDVLAFVRGRIEPVPSASLAFPGAPSVAQKIYLRWALDQVGKGGDNQLVNPNTNDPICERWRVLCSLVTATPDALDEDFDNFITLSGSFPAYTDTLPIIPNNRLLGPWSIISGSPASLASGGIIGIGAPRFGRSSLLLQHVNGIDSTIRISNVNLQPNTIYTVYISLRTVYGAADLSLQPLSVQVGSNSASFPTLGGGSLLGDFVQNSFSFNSLGGGLVAVTLKIPAAADGTQILIDGLLITAQAFTSELDRHHFLVATAPVDGQPVVPTISVRSNLLFSDLAGQLPASRVSVVPYKDLSSLTGRIASIGSDGGGAFITFGLPIALPPNGSVITDGTTGQTTTFVAAGSTTSKFYVASTTGFNANDAIAITASASPLNGQQAFQLLVDLRALLHGDSGIAFDVAPAVKSTQAPQAVQIQNGTLLFAEDTGAGPNVYVGAYAPAITAYIEGMALRLEAGHTNTGASTFDAGAGPLPIKRPDGTAIKPQDIQVGAVITLIFINDGGGIWQLQRTSVAPIETALHLSAPLGADVHLHPGPSPTAIATQTLTVPSLAATYLAFIEYLAHLDSSSTSEEKVVIGMNDGSADALISRGDIPNVTGGGSNSMGLFKSGFMPTVYAAGASITFKLNSYGLPKVDANPSGPTGDDSGSYTGFSVRWIPLS